MTINGRTKKSTAMSPFTSWVDKNELTNACEYYPDVVKDTIQEITSNIEKSCCYSNVNAYNRKLHIRAQFQIDQIVKV